MTRMDLLEYQAKALFQEVGIPVPPSQTIARPKDLKGLMIPYPIALKSQVYGGGRGRMGGIRFVENTIDAIAVAQTIFNLPIMGEYPKVLLAEAKYNVDREFYLAIMLNRSIRRPVLLGSTQGGIDIQQHIDQIHHIVVEQEFSPYYARRLVIKMGLSGELIRTISAIVEKMYHLFAQKDLDLIEINPLGISSEGHLIALDGKISVNDDALTRQAALAELITDSGGESYDPQQAGQPILLETDGQIGILCNGAGLTMATVDLVGAAGGKPAAFLNLGGETRFESSPAILRDRLAQGLEQMAQIREVQVLLVNLVTGLLNAEELMEVIAAFLKRRSLRRSELLPAPRVATSNQIPTIVVRLVGNTTTGAEAIKQHFDQLFPIGTQVIVVESLDEAASQSVALAKKAA